LRFIRDTIVTLSASIIAIILALISTILVARVLGPEGKGGYSLLLLIPTMLGYAGNMGLGIANAYFGGSKKAGWSELASNSLISGLVVGTVLAGAFAAYYFAFHPYFLREVESKWLVAALPIVPPSLLTAYFTYSLLGQKRIRAYNVMQVAPAILSVVLVAIALELNGGVLGVVLTATVGAVFSAVLSLLLVLRETRITWSFHPRLFVDSVRYGMQGHLGSIIQLLNYRLDTLMVAYFMDIAYVGYYSIAVTLAEALFHFPATVGTMIFARTIGLSTDEANQTTPRICRNTLLITLLAALAVFLVSRYVILLLYGSDFLPSVRPLWILLPGIVSLSVYKVLGNEIAGRGKPMINTIATGVSLVVNVSLNLLLIPKWGISGAAFASTVSYTVTAIVTLVLFTRISGNSWFDTIVVKGEDLKTYMKLATSARSGILAFMHRSRSK
jgi:O-antigen/teichoic acid export membrane protein